jgi:hypothetical protein
MRTNVMRGRESFRAIDKASVGVQVLLAVDHGVAYDLALFSCHYTCAMRVVQTRGALGTGQCVVLGYWTSSMLISWPRSMLVSLGGLYVQKCFNIETIA